MKSKTHYSIPILALALLISSCGQKESNCGYDKTTNVYYALSDDAKTKIPYTGTETIAFVSDAGDTATLTGQGKKDYDVTTTSGSSIADCGSTPQYTYHHENIKIDFVGGNSSLRNLTFTLYKAEEINNPVTNSIKILFNDVVLTKSNLEYINSIISSPQDSILLNGVYEAGVYISLNTKTVLINYNKGILKFTDTNNKIWTKIQ